MSAVMEHGGGPVQRLAHPARAISLYDLFRKQPAEYLCPGRSLFVEGDDAAHVFEVLDGALRVFKSVSDGRRVITGFMYPGDIVGVSLGKHYLGSVEAVCGSTVRRLPRSRMDAAVDADKRIRPMVFSLVADEMAAAQRQMILLSCKNSEERLCSFLLEYLNRSAFPGERFPCLNLPMCRQDIADYLGLTIETVSRAITKLIDKGVLQIENAAVRQTITIAKPLLLAQIAGEVAPSMPTAEDAG
jgi:CRP/FNR family transcriptional regulator, anaerobic regulatory protein